jgi:hypothetical protein
MINVSDIFNLSNQTSFSDAMRLFGVGKVTAGYSISPVSSLFGQSLRSVYDVDHVVLFRITVRYI